MLGGDNRGKGVVVIVGHLGCIPFVAELNGGGGGGVVGGLMGW